MASQRFVHSGSPALSSVIQSLESHSATPIISRFVQTNTHFYFSLLFDFPFPFIPFFTPSFATWSSDFKAPLRHCSAIISSRRAKRGSVFPTASDGLAPDSRVPPMNSPDQFASDIESWLSLRVTSRSDQWDRMQACLEAFG
jgi:hypothetical protein